MTAAAVWVRRADRNSHAMTAAAMDETMAEAMTEMTPAAMRCTPPTYVIYPPIGVQMT